MSMILENVKVQRHSRVIAEHINLEVVKGELTVILGLNGAGKTTLIKAAAGILPIVEGKVLIEGKSLGSMKTRDRAKKITYVPQQMSCDLEYTVRDFVLMGITPYLNFWQTPGISHYRKVDEVLESLKLSSLKSRRLAQLSGGEKQMIYLARALMQKADIMLLDEPTAHLDFKRQHEFLHALREVKNRTHQAVLICLHDPNLALQYADRITVLHDKKLIGEVVLSDTQRQQGESQKALVSLLKKAYGDEVRLNEQDESSIVYLKTRGREEDDCN